MRFSAGAAPRAPRPAPRAPRLAPASAPRALPRRNVTGVAFPVDIVTQKGDDLQRKSVVPVETPSMNTPLWTFVHDYHIEKLRLPVVLVTSDGVRLSGDLFVQPNSRHRVGHECAPELLNGPENFLPLATMQDNVLLLAKRQIRELLVAREDVDEPEWEFGTPASVRVRLAGGTVHSGMVAIERSAASQRVLDYLNKFSQRFLQLSTEEGVVLINRDFIVHLEQAD